MNLISGVRRIAHNIHADTRGDLIAFEEMANLPFPLKRVFIIRVNDPQVVRGGHANSCDELIVALSGSVLIEVDNGDERSHVRLHAYDRALWVRAGILIHLREFEPGTLLLVFASERYVETRHFDQAQPQLIMTDGFV